MHFQESRWLTNQSPNSNVWLCQAVFWRQSRFIPKAHHELQPHGGRTDWTLIDCGRASSSRGFRCAQASCQHTRGRSQKESYYLECTKKKKKKKKGQVLYHLLSYVQMTCFYRIWMRMGTGLFEFLHFPVVCGYGDITYTISFLDASLFLVRQISGSW